MTEYMTEQEQIEQLKNWIKQYGPTILAGVLMAVVIVTGWRAWQRHETKMLLHASAIYDEMLSLKAQNKDQDASLRADKLITHYAKTPYAQMAAFLQANNAVTQKLYPEAITHLHWVKEHSGTSQFVNIAALRTARILLAENKTDEALAELNTLSGNSFKGMADETRGDIYVSLHKNNEAKAAYTEALKELPVTDTAHKPILQMKLDNLATVSDTLS